MANVFERLGKVAQAEWTALRKKRPADDLGKDADEESLREAEDAARGADGSARTTSARTTRVPPTSGRAVHDVDGALRVLELTGTPTLAEVRERYRALAKRYQPKTQSRSQDEAHAAHQVMDALTDALELLEEHLLPLPPP
jgi:hypothetical protein